MRTLLSLAAALALAAPVSAQQAPMPDHGQFPPGWQARVDRDAPRDQVWLMDHGTELHASTGPAGAVYYHPEWTKSGAYAASMRFRQVRASPHPEGYGIVIGGKELDGPGQSYSYFLVRQTGEYFIATRRGGERVKVVDWTPHEAIRGIGEDGRAENVLGVEVRGDEVVFTANGAEVARRPRAGLETDGLLALRVNHNLELLVDGVRR